MNLRQIPPSKWAKLFLTGIGILILCCLCSCNVTKDITKTKTEVKTDTETKTVSERTITTTSIEPITTKADSAQGEITVKELEEGKEIDVKTPDGLELIVNVNPVTKKVTAKAKVKEKKIDVPVKKVVVERVTEDKKEEVETVKTEKDKHVERTGGLNWNYLWWLLLLLLIPVWKYRKKLFG